MKCVLALAVSAIGMSASAFVFAEGVSPSDDVIQEITVTAQRREESQQRTALSIDVVSAAQLREQGITRADDLTRVIPGVQIGGTSTTQIYIRGVGDFGVVATANPAVVTSLNGVAIDRPQAISGNFFDLERVELLKGPQGTLYGRNANGGALNLLPVRPVLGENSGYLEASFGNYAMKNGEGAANFALGSDHAIRASFQVTDRSGYLTDGSDDDKHQSLRLQSFSRFSDMLNLRTEATYTHLGGEGSGFALIPAIPGQSPWTGSASSVAAAYYAAAAAAQFAASGGASVPPALLDAPDSANLFQNIRSWSLDAELNYDFGPATLTVIPAYRDTQSRFADQPNFLYGPGAGPTRGDTSHQYSLETRLGHDADRLHWVVGFYGLGEDQTSDFLVDSGLVQRVHIASDLTSRAYAGFGQLTFGLTDTFRLTAGVRYTSDKRSESNFQKFAVSPTVLGTPPCIGLPGTQCALLPQAPSAYDSDKTFSKATWKAGIEYDVLPESMLYANVGTGFKAGGFNQAVDPVNTSRTLAFDPETLKAYTVGLKNRFLNDRLQLNVEGFYWDYRDLQLSTLILDGSGQVSLTTQNAGRARTDGFSGDLIAKPWRGGTVHVGYEYVDSKYQQFSFLQAAALTNAQATGCNISPASVPPGPAGPFVVLNCSGLQLVRSPTNSASFGMSQLFNLTSGGNITVASDGAYADAHWTSTSFVAQARAPSYVTIGASATYNAPGDRWYVSAWGHNLNEAKMYTGGGGDESPFVAGYVTSSIGAPRTYGVRGGVRW